MRRLSGSWTLSRVLPRIPRRSKRKGQRTRSFRFEPLEARHMLAVLTVNSFDDNTTASDGFVTLREAIAAANNDTTTDLGHTGSGADTIVFDPAVFNTPRTITLGGTQLTISEDLTIEGPGAELLSISGDNASRVFYINSGIEATIQDLTITEGLAAESHGGGIYSKGDLTLKRVVVSHNAATPNSGGQVGWGGGVYSDLGDLKIIDSTIEFNDAYNGGGIAKKRGGSDELLEVTGSTVAYNEVAAVSGSWHARAGGILIYAFNTFEASIVNSTVSNNSALYAAGILAVGNSSLAVDIVNSTIAQNDAFGESSMAGEGGIKVDGATVELHNTIVALNTSNAATRTNIGPGLSSGSTNNIIGVQSYYHDFPTGNANQLGVSSTNLALAPLGDYGGVTKTHALLPTSVAINAGNNTYAMANDQRGTRYIRDPGTHNVDIGAVEANVVQPGPHSPVVIYGTDGADGIYVGYGIVTLDTVGGYEFYFETGNEELIEAHGLGGDDVINIDPLVTLDATINGGDGDDLIIGGGGDDTLRGGLGADTIHGGGGSDVLYGYLDDDVYLGGDGADTLFSDGDGMLDELWVEFGSDLYYYDPIATDDVYGNNAAAPAYDEWESIIKTDNAGFGAGWDLAPMDKLVFGFDVFNPDRIRWVRSDGYLIDFDDFEETSLADETASVITDEGGYYLRRDKYGNEFHYSKALANEGALIKSVNRLGVGYEYTYGDHDGDFQEWEIETVAIVRPGQDAEVITYDYDSTNRVQSIIDSYGRVTEFVYTGGGQIEQILLPAPDSTAPSIRPTFLFEYDAHGFIDKITDADGRETEYLFDHVADFGTGKVTITYDDGGEEIMLPAIGNIYGHWRSQLGSWAEFLPTFKYKFLTGDPEYGYLQEKLDTDVYRTTTFTVNSGGYLTEMIDAAGNVTTYTRTTAGLPDVVTVTASGSGSVVSITDYDYNSKHNLTKITYTDGTFETWDYDPDFSQVIEHIDQLGRQTVYELDIDGNVIEMRLVVGAHDGETIEDDIVTLYEYTADGLIEQVIELRNDPDESAELSLVTQYTYTNVDDGSPHIGRWLQSITYGGDDPDTGGISLVNPSTVAITSRNAFGMPETVEDELERETTFEYDDLDRLIKVTAPDPGNGQDIPITQYVYHLSGLLEDEIKTWDGGGSPITTHFTYDAVGRLKTIVEDEGGLDAETEYFYDLVGNVVEVVNPLAQSTKFTYDVLDRAIRITQEDPDDGGALASPVTLLAYDALGRLIATRDPVNSLTRREHDLLGRVERVIGPLNTTTSFIYDDAGQLVRRTDSQGRIFGYAYDDAGRLIATLAPGLASPTIFEYDTASNLRFVTDPLNNTSERLYDERGRIVESIDANGDSTLYTYTDANEPETLTDANLNTTTWTYDGAGRVASETNELSHARTYEYDGLGRLVEYTDRNGRITTYEYDNLHQLAAEKWWNGESLVRTISYDFDLLGNLLSVSDPRATYEYAYDALNRVTSVEQTITGLTPLIVFDKEYDAAGRMTSSTAKIGGTADYVNSYMYDPLGRLTSVTQTDNGGNAVNDKRVVFTYSDRNQLEAIVRFASTTTSNLVAFSQFSYDEFGRLIYIDHTSLGNYAEAFGYDYDGAGRLASFSSLLDGYSVDYAYDNRHQLLEADYTGGPTDEEYEYDENGNRINGDFTVDTNNRLLSDGTYTYEYDNEGNRTKRTEIATGDYTAYFWDHRNRLTIVADYNSNDTFEQIVWNYYDAGNQLIHRQMWLDFEFEFTIYAHQDGQIVLQFDRTGSNPVTAGDLSHRYLWGPAVDMLLADEAIADGETLWAMTDHLGSVRDIVDDNGTLRKHVQYDSFGNVTDEDYFDTAGDPIAAAHAEAIAQLFGYTGRPRDKTTGLQNNLHRWYDPTVGRWLSEDPVGFAAGDANLYRYVGNAATMGVDPSGLATIFSWKSTQGNFVSEMPGTGHPTTFDSEGRFGVKKKNEPKPDPRVTKSEPGNTPVSPVSPKGDKTEGVETNHRPGKDRGIDTFGPTVGPGTRPIGQPYGGPYRDPGQQLIDKLRKDPILGPSFGAPYNQQPRNQWSQGSLYGGRSAMMPNQAFGHSAMEASREFQSAGFGSNDGGISALHVFHYFAMAILDVLEDEVWT